MMLSLKAKFGVKIIRNLIQLIEWFINEWTFSVPFPAMNNLNLNISIFIWKRVYQLSDRSHIELSLK